MSLSACAGRQSTLDARGPVAESIATLWWVMLAGAVIILVLVMAAVFYAMFRRPERRMALSPVPFLFVSSIVVPTLILTALLVYGTEVGRRITQAFEAPLVVEVTGHQWWWEVHYPAADGLPAFTTANELRLPVDVPVHFRVRSADVIHSFWIPNLGGKVDMIPGRTNNLRLSAGEAGTFRVQCSEFCGAQHARMSFNAIAVPMNEFVDWRRARAQLAAVGETDMQRFIARGCAECHRVGGTAAEGMGGPDLTHFAARIEAGMASNEPPAQALRAWLIDHGATRKPGSHGPEPRALPPEDVEAIAGLLEQLR